MTFKVALKKSDQGYAVWCPSLPGCASQGATRDQALENIQDAIREYLDAVPDPIRLEEADEQVELAL
jgi:predicted RNase H-like HicB family nuclease